MWDGGKRWWWKLLDDPTHKWATILSHNYHPLAGWWSNRCINTSASPLWKGMISVKDIFHKISQDSIQGKRDKVLEGQMVFECPVGEDISKIILASSRPHRTSPFTLVSFRWDIKVPFSNLEKETQNKEELLQLLPDNFSCNRTGIDRPSWEWDPKRIFSVKNAYLRLNDGDLRCSYGKLIWTAKMPPKIRAFLWLVVNGTLLT